MGQALYTAMLNTIQRQTPAVYMYSSTNIIYRPNHTVLFSDKSRIHTDVSVAVQRSYHQPFYTLFAGLVINAPMTIFANPLRTHSQENYFRINCNESTKCISFPLTVPDFRKSSPFIFIICVKQSKVNVDLYGAIVAPT